MESSETVSAGFGLKKNKHANYCRKIRLLEEIVIVNQNLLEL